LSGLKFQRAFAKFSLPGEKSRGRAFFR